jgi:plasmid stabilization system protein ParE
MELKIFWTQTALRQRNYIFEYWNTRNKSISYSRKLNDKIKERISFLKSDPELGSLTEFINTRVLSLGHYRIFYQRKKESIIITSIWDNRQNPGRLIELLSKEI